MSELQIKEGMTLAAYKETCQTLYNNSDKDKNGVLTIDEWKGFLQACAVASGENPDDLEGDEGQAFAKEFFGAFDTNEDGKVSWDEAWKILENEQPGGPTQE